MEKTDLMKQFEQETGKQSAILKFITGGQALEQKSYPKLDPYDYNMDYIAWLESKAEAYDRLMSSVSTSHLDCWNEEESTCPFCGYAQSDSWEIEQDSQGHLGDIECDNCSKIFEAQRDVTVTYTSSPKGSDGSWNKGDIFEDGLEEDTK